MHASMLLRSSQVNHELVRISWTLRADESVKPVVSPYPHIFLSEQIS